jgi:hypothetical protein
MNANDSKARAVVQIGVFAAHDGWLLTHPVVQSRFENREEALAAAQRLAHLEAWRGFAVDVLTQDPMDSRLESLGPFAGL